MASWKTSFSSMFGYSPKAAGDEADGDASPSQADDPVSRMPVRVDLPEGAAPPQPQGEKNFGPAKDKPETPSSKPPRSISTSKVQDPSRSYNSFGSVGLGSAGVNSFGSTMTDYDNLISPGAQAENDPRYRQAVYQGPYGTPEGMAHLWAMNGLMPPAYPGQAPFPPFNPAMAAAAMGSMMPPPMAMGGMPPPVPFAPMPGPPMGAAPDHAAHWEAAAEQYMAAARQLQAAARSARGDKDTGGGSQASMRTKGRKKTGGNTPTPGQAHGTLPGVTEAPLPGEQGGHEPPMCEVPEEERTTVMMRNLPNDYTREMLLELLDEQGFKGAYDFVYLPQDFKRKAGLGYAFVNLQNHDVAERARKHFEGFSTWKFASQKVCEAAWGTPLQGLEQHVERYKNSPLMHGDVPDEFKPILFKEGVRIAFPAPTKRLRPPRVKLQNANSSEAGVPPT